MKSYKPVKEGDKFTIAQWDEGYCAYITNDGIYNYYFWDTLEEATAAANAYNTYKGCEWLGQHGYGNDIVDIVDLEDVCDEDMIELYGLFNAVIIM